VFGVSQLVVKQQKTEEGLHRADVDYFNSLMQLERGRQEWEALSFECCDALEVSCTDHVLTGQDGWGVAEVYSCWCCLQSLIEQDT